MTDLQKEQIKKLRVGGVSYRKVAESLDLSENTVKSYCRRNNLGASSENVQSETQAESDHCKFCEQEIHQHEKQKKRKFCDETCRTQYWRNNQEKINRKSAVTQKCVICGEEFSDYAKNIRKYCSRKCYQTARIKGGVADES